MIRPEISLNHGKLYSTLCVQPFLVGSGVSSNTVPPPVAPPELVVPYSVPDGATVRPREGIHPSGHMTERP